MTGASVGTGPESGARSLVVGVGARRGAPAMWCSP